MAKRWTPSEEKFLLENYGKVPMTELAQRFGVTRKAISAKLDKLRASYGIRPTASRDHADELQRAMPSAAALAARPEPTVRRPLPRRAVPLQSPDPINTEAYGPKVPSGLFVKTEEGWKPILVDKEQIVQ
jgi:biotin operon repressor